MAFCTMVEWNETFDLDQYDAMIERSGGHDRLPAGCLSRIVGATATGARVIEVWESNDDARRFAEENGPAIADAQLRPPDRVVFFETTFYRAR